MIDAKKLLLKPSSIVPLTYGDPDIGGVTGSEKFRKLAVSPLKGLSHNNVDFQPRLRRVD